MKNIDIIRGYRTFGHEDLYASDSTERVEVGDVIGLDGKKATLGTSHVECGIAIESNYDATGAVKPSGKIPVYVSNFVVRFYQPAPADVSVGDPLTIIDGKPAKLDDNHTVVWGYITAMTDTSFDVRVNY